MAASFAASTMFCLGKAIGRYFMVNFFMLRFLLDRKCILSLPQKFCRSENPQVNPLLNIRQKFLYVNLPCQIACRLAI